MAGYVTDEELVELYQQAWLVTSASTAEGWGMTLTEAAACGTPAVATNIAGHRDSVADGKSGVLVDSSRGMVTEITRLLGDDEARARTVRGGPQARGGSSPGRPRRTTPSSRWPSRPSPSGGSPGGRRARDRLGRYRRPAAPRPLRGPAGRRARRTAPTGAPRRTVLGIAVPALIAYIPLLLTHRGMVGADTKTYLYLDPGKLLSEVPHVWDSQIGLGTVTHQNIGYLFPMGPFYLFFDAIGVPDWVAQRLWLGTVLFLAGMGVRYLLRTLRDPEAGPRPHRHGRRRDPRRHARLHVEPLHPQLLGPHLGPAAALGRAALADRPGRPRRCATAAGATRRWFAFTMLLVGGINATAVIMVGAGPALWVVHAVWIDREVALPRGRCAAVGRITVLTLRHQPLVGRRAVGRGPLRPPRHPLHRELPHRRRGLDAPEVLRGLGYWFFYGTDKLGPWIEPSERVHDRRSWLLVVSYAAADPRPHRRRAGPVALPGLLHRAHRRSGRSPPSPATRGTTRRSSARSSRRSPAATPACRCARRPGPCPWWCSAPRCSSAPASTPSAAGAPRSPVPATAAACVLVVAQPAAAVERHDDRQEPRARPRTSRRTGSSNAAYLQSDGQRHPGARDPGHRVRQLPLGQHRRPRSSPA